ncbi:MBL fold metallo-hydrolase [Actibacterium sp. MT2.3-13A]|uniref:MBL fold metallo-hydrolase n=1 Tax=Actibacterium sp. MT2.3-13A TaxID=2828332 RepID=UPI001BABBA41|nr:MBL fold metallo-hydrolase [Actibacterium sp. MT2.3-13A]
MIRFALALLVFLAAPAEAQDRRPSHCIALAQAAPGLEYVQLAAFGAPLERNTVRLGYIDHSMFVLETAGGLTAVTDYTGFIGNLDLIPDVVTMNNAHDSHWTAFPDPAIPHVLEGWAREGRPADHHLDLGEMLVRNVPTDTRGRAGGVRVAGNSIFVFEVAGLCIGHLGHLHHEPDAAQYAALGRLDVVMAPVDGGLTLDLPTMIRVLQRLRSSVVIPMHWFSEYSLQRFLDGMEKDFAILRPGESALEVSLRGLPPRPSVVVLEPAFLRPPED